MLENEPNFSLESLKELLPETPTDLALRGVAQLALILVNEPAEELVKMSDYSAEQILEIGKLAYPFVRSYLLDPGTILTPFQRWVVIQRYNMDGIGGILKKDFTDESLKEKFNVSLAEATRLAINATTRMKVNPSLELMRALVKRTVLRFGKTK
jgi:hypothetical protein